MNLFALALLVCNLHTSECHWYVKSVHATQAECDNAAIAFAKRPTVRGVEMLDCRPMGRPRRKHE